MSGNWMFDGEGIEFADIQRMAALAQQQKILNELKNQTRAIEQTRTSGSASSSSNAPSSAEKRKSLYRCPHCGGDLPDDSPSKHYRKCCNCSGELFWFGIPYGISAAFADQPTRDAAVASSLIHTFKCLAPSADRFSAGFCIYTCAVVAAFDSRLSAAELRVFVEGLSWSGMPPASIEAQVVKACRRVHTDGVESWIDRLDDMIRGGEGKRGDGGMPLVDLLQLMHRVFTNGGGDAVHKAEVFRRIVKLFGRH